ncbi:D-alanyl-D-alanine carboxypeptidase [Myxococcota bacterium]|nr:D-alanyl-D-alanine carboxypeptidase [Myxococcota bacterium]
MIRRSRGIRLAVVPALSGPVGVALSLAAFAVFAEIAAVAVLAVFTAPGCASAESDLAAQLQAEARRIVGADQGVQVELADGTVLVSQASTRAVHPASVSKIPTTLALLRKLGPDHRFETRFLARSPIGAGAVEGPLVVRADGDPYFVDENALLVARALRDLGLRSVRGELVVEGKLLFDWKAEALAPRLRRVFEGQVPAAAWQAVRTRTGDASARAPRFAFGPRSTGAAKGKDSAADGAETLLVVHRSQPLLGMLKALNGYSNNIFAPFADAAGGIHAVETAIRTGLPAAYREELVLGDGAGAHPKNRMSPRATVEILRQLEAELGPHGLDLSDVLPVAGIDDGTLKKRLAGPKGEGLVVAKTGTFGDYGACALAGALRTREHGLVYFAILNRGVPIDEGRRRQDAFVRVLMKSLAAEPWTYQRDDAPAFTRAEVVSAANGGSGGR